jgi:surfactin synthase thioesterase subunit/acyl carrier protein
MFDNLMHRDVDQIAVAVADWPIYAGKMGKSSFLAELLNGNEHSRTSEFAPAKTALHVFPRAKSERVEVAEAEPATSGGDARTRLQSILQQHIMAELGFVEPIDLDQPLNEVGLDSLRSVTLSNILEDALGIPVSVAELIRGPTINQLVDHLVDEFAAVRSRIGEDQRQPLGWRQITNGSDATAIETVVNANDPQAYPAIRTNEETQSINTGNGVGGEGPRPIVRPSGKTALRTAGKWLIAPRPKPGAKARLFCFPYAGGGLVSFRSWAQSLDDSVEVVAVEPPGRGTRIDESPVDELDSFVERLLQEMVDWLDRPSAFFGHCLGGLTMFATLCALPKGRAHFIKYLFACGVRPPHLLKHRGEFEDNLVYDMMLHKEFDVRVPPYAQVDDIVADIIRHFDTPAADKMLETPKLRAALLPTIRADFKMAHNYQFRPVQPFAFPISSFVGNLDPWVSEKDSAGWGEFTCGGFTNHVRKGSHFLMAEDRDYILATITKEFVNQATH